jgi:glycosyltransferase involved in cell wall biosynthesis
MTDPPTDAANDRPTGPLDAGIARLLGVMVTYQRPGALDDHLGRLARQTRRLDRIVVVDNDASGADEVADLVARHQSAATAGVEHQRTETNLGPAGGIARGMEWAVARAGDDDWIVVLDDDDPPATDDVVADVLSVAACAGDDVGAVGIVGSTFDRRTGRLRRFTDRELREHRDLIDVDYLGSNQFPMYRVAAVRAAGVFDPSLFWGYDDLDYGLRLRRAGYRLVISGELALRARARYGRLEGDDPLTTSTPSVAGSWRRYYTTRNLVHILRKHGLDPVARRRATVAAIAPPLRAATRDPRAALVQLGFGARGLVDGWAERMGARVAPRAKSSDATVARP